ncbi:hypothetical protein [Paenarthrobacter ilicis]|uniref:Uncharacterized protein n=1 Tax=Paenarthrobacter ilicis TaxID=43665 RepID=A0ABX0TEB4_9MICC|nr:hypothetical protein [Paenarthrobacter ilicis]MBM7794249.1 hypothetical protein [Paenarthrobacter ilicis]NIJ00429.1 hypothetical protein [Paenarthrobacter ilicis]
MSNPPYPPSNPGDSNQPEQSTPPAAPQYGQQSTPPAAPQYGQQSTPPAAPQYGQQSAPGAPQFGQQASPYGQAPAAPQYGQGSNWPGQPAAPVAMPPMVNYAFWMIVAAGILSAISSLLLATTGADAFINAMNQQAAQQGTDFPEGSMEGMRGVIGVSAVIGAVVSLGLYALVAFPVRKGKNWARILGTVFAAISVLGLTSVFQFGSGYGILQLIVILLGVAAIVMLYLPASAPYFRKPQPFANPYSR